MLKPTWVDYSGATPILLPVRIEDHWEGFYLHAGPDESMPDLMLPHGTYKISDTFDFRHPKTDYDRACALGRSPAVQRIDVGPGFGFVFATERDRLTWWPEQRMLVNGSAMPDPSKLQQVAWSDELSCEIADSDFVLMNACNHGGDPRKGPHFHVHLPPGKYVVQRGRYGWSDRDPSLVLFRFLRQGTGPGVPT